MFSYILIIATRIAAVPLAKAIRVMIMLRISGVLPILLIRRSKDITVNWIRSIDSTLTIEVSLFSATYKKAGSIIQAIAITNRLPPVSSPLFTTEIMRRFEAMINVEQMIKKDFLFIYDTSHTIVFYFKPKKYSSNYCKPSRRKAVLPITSFLVFFKYWFFIEDKNGKLIKHYSKK